MACDASNQTATSTLSPNEACQPAGQKSIGRSPGGMACWRWSRYIAMPHSSRLQGKSPLFRSWPVALAQSVNPLEITFGGPAGPTRSVHMHPPFAGNPRWTSRALAGPPRTEVNTTSDRDDRQTPSWGALQGPRGCMCLSLCRDFMGSCRGWPRQPFRHALAPHPVPSSRPAPDRLRGQ